jgi:hypothetical protein
MRLQVTSITYNGGTVASGTGLDDEGIEHSFYGDWRPMQAIAQAIANGDETFADVPSWALA